jgi:hypothetical protein
MNGMGAHGHGRRGSGRAAKDRSHSRPPGAASPAAASAGRVAAMLGGVLAAPGITVAAVARALGARPVEVARWRRGQPIPGYRRAELEARIARLEVILDAETGVASVVVR